MPQTGSAEADNLTAVLRGRRSIDLFAPDVVDSNTVRAAVEVARWAPNHRLTEPWRFYLLRAATLRSVMFVLTSALSEDPLLERENYAACCCAAQNLMLYLWGKGIGVKWTTGAITRQPQFSELLGIDSAKESVVGLFWYGVPKVIPTQRRRPVEEIVKELP